MANELQAFSYERVDSDMAKKVVPLCRTDLLTAGVQIIKDGGENNLHAHPGNDGFWFVLAGRARFYGEGDVLLGEFGKHEGILVPRGVKYWFESASPETLEIMRVGAAAAPNDIRRVDHAPITAATVAAYHDAHEELQTSESR